MVVSDDLGKDVWISPACPTKFDEDHLVKLPRGNILVSSVSSGDRDDTTKALFAALLQFWLAVRIKLLNRDG